MTTHVNEADLVYLLELHHPRDLVMPIGYEGGVVRQCAECREWWGARGCRVARAVAAVRTLWDEAAEHAKEQQKMAHELALVGSKHAVLKDPNREVYSYSVRFDRRLIEASGPDGVAYMLANAAKEIRNALFPIRQGPTPESETERKLREMTERRDD